MRRLLLSMSLIFTLLFTSFASFAQTDPCVNLAVKIELSKRDLSEMRTEREQFLEQLDESIAQMDEAEKKAKRRLYIWIAPTIIVGVVTIWATAWIQSFASMGNISFGERIVSLLPTVAGAGATYGGVQLMRVPRKEFKAFRSEVEQLRANIVKSEENMDALDREIAELEVSYMGFCSEK